jgi:hypothetical protein
VKILPRTESPALRWTVIGLATFCALAAALDFRNGYGGDHADWAWAIIFWLPLGIGLWALQPWARWIALMLLWPLAFIFVGIPFAQMDYTTTEPPCMADGRVVGAVVRLFLVLDSCARQVQERVQMVSTGGRFRLKAKSDRVD